MSANFTNTGNEASKIIGHILIDTVIGEDFIRKAISDKKFMKHYEPRELQVYSFYEDIDMAPGDTVKIRLRPRIEYPEQTQFVLHYLMLYYNDYRVLYDSYFWFRFNLGELIIKDLSIYNDTIMRITVNKEQFKNLVKYQDSNMTSKMYSKKEMRRVLRNLDGFDKAGVLPENTTQ